MSQLLSDAIAVQLGAQEPWPDNVSLFQPRGDSQIILPEIAHCLSVKTFLRMCDLKYRVVHRFNAEHMSPSGKIPFLQVGPMLISELDPIVTFVNTKDHHLSSYLNDVEKAEMKAYIALIENVLGNAERYISWCDVSVAKQVSKQRCGSAYSWPLNVLIPWKREIEEKQYLKLVGWFEKTFDEVSEEVQTCSCALSEKLGNQKFFFGDKPTELDAVMFGHIDSLLKTEDLPNKKFSNIIKTFPNLLEFCNRVNQMYFNNGDGDK